MAKELVELGAYFHDTLRGLLLNNHIADFVAVCLPVRLRNRYWTIETAEGEINLNVKAKNIVNRIRLHFESFKD